MNTLVHTRQVVPPALTRTGESTAAQRYAWQSMVHAMESPAVACLGGQHRVLTYNKAAMEALPVCQGEVGGTFRDLWPPLRGTIEYLLNAAFAGHPGQLDESLCNQRLSPDGREIYDSLVSPLLGSNGDILGVLWTFHEVTARLAERQFVETLMRQAGVWMALVSLPARTVTWATQAAWQSWKLADVHAAVDLAAEALLPPSLVSALAAVEDTETVCHVDTVAGLRYTLLPVIREGEAARALIYALPV